MRCDRVQQMLDEENGLTTEAIGHAERCSVCAAYLREWRLVKMGLSEIAREAPPEASIGFTARLMRRIEEGQRSAPADQTFLEQVGRRFVYATMVLAFVALLALALPSSGPLRSPGSAEVMLAEPEVAIMQNEPVIGIDATDARLPADNQLGGGAPQGK
jgi:hypothetical protein